jgi:hypothetical protein
MTQAPSPDDASPLARRGRPWHWQLALKGLRARLDVHHQAAFTDLDVISFGESDAADEGVSDEVSSRAA